MGLGGKRDNTAGTSELMPVEISSSHQRAPFGQNKRVDIRLRDR